METAALQILPKEAQTGPKHVCQKQADKYTAARQENHSSHELQEFLRSIYWLDDLCQKQDSKNIQCDLKEGRDSQFMANALNAWDGMRSAREIPGLHLFPKIVMSRGSKHMGSSCISVSDVRQHPRLHYLSSFA